MRYISPINFKYLERNSMTNAVTNFKESFTGVRVWAPLIAISIMSAIYQVELGSWRTILSVVLASAVVTVLNYTVLEPYCDKVGLKANTLYRLLMLGSVNAFIGVCSAIAVFNI